MSQTSHMSIPRVDKQMKTSKMIMRITRRTLILVILSATWRKIKRKWKTRSKCHIQKRTRR